MITSLINRILLGILRHLLSLAGGALLAHGLITHDQERVVEGSGIAIVAVALSAAEKVATATSDGRSATSGATAPAPKPNFTGHAGGSGGQGKS